MLAPTYALLGFAVLALVLGFVALLKQKTYIDSATNQPTELELPLFGKLKTNYPALVFVFLACGLAWRVGEKLEAGKEEWSITGSFRADSAAPAWEQGTLTVFPTAFRAEITNRGTFRITANLPRGATFEDVVDYIDFSHPAGSVQFSPRTQFARFSQHDSTSLIREATARSRMLKPLTLTTY